MDIRVIPPCDLTADELGVWSALQCANPQLHNPYFSPEFTQAVASVRDDVEVAVFSQAGSAIGFFPFQRTFWNNGRPVGGRLSDFQGLIAAEGTQCDPQQLVRACRLRSLNFDHLLASQEAFHPFVWREDDSPYIDLADGYDGYISGRANGRSLLSEYGQRSRKMAREVGPLRFEPHLPDSAVLTKCLEWKALQYRRARLPNLFAFDWVVDLFERLLSLRSDSFSSMISVLYAGDQMVSIILSLRYRDVLHAWFPAYDRQFAHYSPGTLLWFEMMRASQQLGIRRIELGKGPEKFKRRFMSGATRVAEGAVDPRPVTAAMRNAWQKTRSWIQSSSFNAPARAPAQLIYRCRSWIEYH